MDAVDLKAIFGIFDVARTGQITMGVYEQAMQSAGITAYNKQPEGYIMDRVSLDTFVAEGTKSLGKSHQTYAPKI